MENLGRICEQIEKEVADLRGKATQKNWAGFTRRAFVYNLVNIIPGIEELEKLFESAKQEADATGESHKPDLEMHLREIKKLLEILERNKELEESRIHKVTSQGRHELVDAITVPELYADLEQKTLSMLLKSNYLVERIRVFERKREPVMKTKAAQRNILDLLEKREDELQSLKKKYDETRKKSFLGLVDKDMSIETENELNELARSIEGKTALLKKNFETMKETNQRFQREMLELSERISEVEEIDAQITGKTFELITMLKKERDYVKRVLMDIEQETLQLRNTYSKEILNLQEEKLSLKNSIEEKYEIRLKEMKNDMRGNNELLQHFKEMAGEKEKKLIQL